MSYHNYQRHVETAGKLEEVSDSYCVAKWKQVTLHLQNGHTHSCHHPRTHKIPVSEIRRNPSALHNTTIKKEQRRMMLDGDRPPECSYCWRVEDSNIDNFSDRIKKSSEPWALPYLQECATMPYDYDVDPSYVEISFSNTCNFKCTYCAPHISSKWMEEILEYGPYDTKYKFNNLEWIKHNDQMPILNREYNPYVDAFWVWWPKLYKQLQTFRITGGEPLLTKDTFKVLEYIMLNPNPNLELCVNTNLCVPDELLNKFLDYCKTIVDTNCVKTLRIYTSCEAHGKQAEYIRYGMNYDTWIQNLHRVLQIGTIPITVMSTYNILSVHTYTQFLDDMLKLKIQYIDMYHNHKLLPLYIDIPFLLNPQHLTAFMLPHSELHYLEDSVNFMWANGPLYTPTEIEGIQRVLNLVKNSQEDERINRGDFFKFVDEADRRRNTNFSAIFPHLEAYRETWMSDFAAINTEYTGD